MDIWPIVLRLARGVLRRRKLQAILLAVVTTAVVGVAVYVHTGHQPPRYRTNAVIVIQTRPTRSPVFDEMAPSRPVNVQLAVLRSRNLAEGVLDSLALQSFEELRTKTLQVDYLRDLDGLYERWTGAPATNGKERALAELTQRVTFNPMNDGSDGQALVEIGAVATRPAVATDIALTYIEVLLSRTKSFNIDDAHVSRKFLEQQLADVRTTLRNNQEALRRFTVAHGSIRIPDQSQAAVTRLSQTETALAEVEASRQTLATRLKALREKVERQQKDLPAPVATAPPPPPPVPLGIQRLRAQLTHLEGSLLELRVNYTDEHPRVVLVKRRISELQRQLQGVLKETTPVAPLPAAVPPAERADFGDQLIAVEASYHALTAQEDALRAQANALRKNLRGLSESEQQYSTLQRDVASAQALYEVLSDRLTAARIREQGEMKAVNVIDPPVAAPLTNPRNLVFVVVVALCSGVAVGAGVPAGLEWLRLRVETEDDVRRATGLSVLAVIPRLPRRLVASIPALQGEAVAVAVLFTEAFRTLRVAVQLAGAEGQRPRTLMVISPLPEEGKSTVLMNLGWAFQETQCRVILADTDFVRPVLARQFHVHSGAELVDTLGSGAVDDALVSVADGMWVAGQRRAVQPRARGQLASGHGQTLVHRMAKQADIVLCDSSPLLAVRESLALARAVDGVILVAKAGSTRCRDLARAKDLLQSSGARVLGTVINHMPASALFKSYATYARAYERAGRYEQHA